MRPIHQSIDIPLFPLVNDEATLAAAVDGPLDHLTFVVILILITNTRLGSSSDSQGQIPSNLNRRLPQAETNSKDGAEALFSMYHQKALEFDSKHIENWREDANSLMILVSFPFD